MIDVDGGTGDEASEALRVVAGHELSGALWSEHRDQEVDGSDVDQPEPGDHGTVQLLAHDRNGVDHIPVGVGRAHGSPAAAAARWNASWTGAIEIGRAHV